MTREEALEILKKYKEESEEDCYVKRVRALDMAIKALEQKPCGDCIRRQAVLDLIVANHTELNGLNVVMYSPLCKDIKQLPLVNLREPKTKWIPVSERLPEESLNSVIGWDMHRERCVFVQYIGGYFQITGSNESFDIVAWMPLPEPYKESEE